MEEGSLTRNNYMIREVEIIVSLLLHSKKYFTWKKCQLAAIRLTEYENSIQSTKQDHI